MGITTSTTSSSTVAWTAKSGHLAFSESISFLQSVAHILGCGHQQRQCGPAANRELGKGNFDIHVIPLCSTHNVPDYSHLAVDIDGAEGNIDPPSACQRRRFGGTNLQTQNRTTSPCNEAKSSTDRLRRGHTPRLAKQQASMLRLMTGMCT